MSVVQTIEDATTVYALASGAHGVGELLHMAYEPHAERFAVVFKMPEGKRWVGVLAADGEAFALTSHFEVPVSKPRVLGFMPEGRLLYATCDEVIVCGFDGEGASSVALPSVEAACVLSDGRVLFLQLHDPQASTQRLVCWDGGAELRELEDKRADGAGSVDVSSDGKLALSTGREPYVRLWDLASGVQLKRATIGAGGSGGDLRYAAFSPDGSVIACGSCDDKATSGRYISLLNADKRLSERARLPLPESNNLFYWMGFSADGERLWASHALRDSELGVISVWDWRVGSCSHQLKLPRAAMCKGEMAISADGRRVFVWSDARLLAFNTP